MQPPHAALDHPDRPESADNASQDLHLSLQHFDALTSDCAWILPSLTISRQDSPCLHEYLSSTQDEDSSISMNYI